MAASISTLKAMLVLDTSKWNAGFAAAQKTAGGFASWLQSGIIGSLGSITKGVALAGASAVTAGFGFHEMMDSLGNVGHLASVAKKLGLTVEQVQRLQFAANKSGVDLDTMANGLLLMGKNIGSGGKSLDKRFLDVADAFTKIKDAGERAAFARSVFGKGGFEFINLLSKGSAGIRQSADAVDRFSLAIKDIDAAKAKETLIAMKELKEVTGAYKDKLVIEFAPAMTAIFKSQLELLARLTDGWKKLIELNKLLTAGKPINAAIQTGTINALVNPMGALLDAWDRFTGKKKPAAAEDLKLPDLGKGIAAEGALKGLHALSISGAAEKGTLEAGRIIQGAGGNAIAKEINGPIVDRLEKLLLQNRRRDEQQQAKLQKGRL